ncbi:MAG TPA: DUF3500 domain-containing protein [Puia sp.]|nr:DUF3500 domain-containing protein [Puia sp.]
MKQLFLIAVFAAVFTIQVKSQKIADAATVFLSLLDSGQQASCFYPFDVDERYSFHYFPVAGPKGIAMDKLNPGQTKAAWDLIKTCLSEKTVEKVGEIIQLEIILKELEHRQPNDHFRDPGKYHLTIFGIPRNNTIWGWRLEGHHVSFNFSANNGKLVAGTPGFLGANPAVVQQGAGKGKEVLKEEREAGFALLHSLTKEELTMAIVDKTAPGDIITYNNREAMIAHPEGLLYPEMSSAQQEQMLQLISLYVHRFTKLFADEMLKEIQEAGLDKLRFAWAGYTEPGLGKPHYYRIQGPTIIIEYDNTQNNANHVHTVIRDLCHDFGGDQLLEHYKAQHQKAHSAAVL